MKALFENIQQSLFRINPPLDYSEIMQSLMKLCELINQTEETDWHIGECSDCCLDDLIIGAYWHFSEWHEGQNSISYQVLSSLGSIYSPNMSTLEDDTAEKEVFNMFEQLAEEVKS